MKWLRLAILGLVCAAAGGCSAFGGGLCGSGGYAGYSPAAAAPGCGCGP